MPTMNEEVPDHSLVTSIKPTGVTSTRMGAGSVGDVALKDSLAIIIGCWLLVGLVYFSLRSFNV